MESNSESDFWRSLLGPLLGRCPLFFCSVPKMNVYFISSLRVGFRFDCEWGIVVLCGAHPSIHSSIPSSITRVSSGTNGKSWMIKTIPGNGDKKTQKWISDEIDERRSRTSKLNDTDKSDRLLPEKEISLVIRYNVEEDITRLKNYHPLPPGVNFTNLFFSLFTPKHLASKSEI